MVRPVICMVTDRRRMPGGGEDALVERVARAARAGVHLVQIRERDLDGGALARLIERCVAAVRGTRTRIVVNDRLDVALAAAAHGVHLRTDSFAASRGRAITSAGFLMGRSVHTPREAVQTSTDGGLDYLIGGTVFKSASKPDQRASGLASLAGMVRATPLPVLAIGGVTVDNAAQVAHTGAAGIAAIGLFADCPLDTLAARVEALRDAFNSIEDES